jgi:hypothetical protein
MRERVNAVWGCFERDMKECSTVEVVSQYLLSNGIHSNADGWWTGGCDVAAGGDTCGTSSRRGISRTWGAAVLRPYMVEVTGQVETGAGSGEDLGGLDEMRLGIEVCVWPELRAGRMDGVSLRAT